MSQPPPNKQQDGIYEYGIAVLLIIMSSYLLVRSSSPSLFHSVAMFSRSAVCALLAAALLVPGAQSFSADQSRRDALLSVSKGAAAFLVGAPALTFLPEPSLAAAVPSSKELERFPLGLARVRYLLDHWEEITTKCGSNPNSKQVVRTEGGGGGFCDRTPLRVQEFLGYKSTDDPLFKADKLMLRAAPLVDPDYFEDYLSVVERYREKADNGSMMAYTSSWGEANPNGSKDAIDEYLERTRDEVKGTEQLLKQVCAYLDLKDLPPIKGPL